jgi:hypothetical protein
VDQRVGAVRPFEVEENYRRYIIQSTERIPFCLTLSQAASWVMGVLFAVGALGMWALAGAGPAAERIGVNMGAAILLAGVFLPLLSSSGRGAAGQGADRYGAWRGARSAAQPCGVDDDPLGLWI